MFLRWLEPVFKVSLEIQDEKRLSGNDLFLLLEYIMLYGSISRAASKAGVSYRYAWGLLQEAEKALGLILVEKQAGGYAGGGALLTAGGRDILREYKDFRGRVDRELSDFLRRAGQIQSLPAGPPPEEEAKNFLLLASTMEPVETGLMDALETAFFQEKGIFVRHLAAGSGRALEIARGGRVDMVLTHAPELEREFMAEGWGAYQFPVMTNDFALVGPAADPAGVASLSGPGEIAGMFGQIAAARAPFVTRGDHSGTHFREMEIWEKAGVQPAGDWYLQYPGVAGNLGAQGYARGKGAYMLTDMASFLLTRGESGFRVFRDTALHPCRELENTFVLTLVNPEKVPSSRLKDASVFARWLLKEKGRKIIAEFGRDTFGKPLFSLLENPA
jgi:tungstate transport system substrate-binding protein